MIRASSNSGVWSAAPWKNWSATAVDIISGTTPQSSALDWTVAAPVVVPYVQIAP